MKRSLLQIGTLTILLFGLISCGSSTEDPKARLDRLVRERDRINTEIQQLRRELSLNGNGNQQAESVSLVQVSTLAPQPFHHYVTVQGNVESDTNIQVPYRASGIIEEVRVVEGDKVKKGDLLVRLDSAVLERGLAELESSLTLATTVYERTKRLWDKNIGSEIDYLTAKNEKERLEKQIETQKEQIRLTRIFSPIEGTVDNVLSRVGEAAVAGAPSVRIVKLSELTIRAAVSESFIGSIRTGDTVQVDFPTLGKQMDLNISAVGRVVDKDNRTFNIEIEVPDSEADILPNLTAVLTINDYSRDDAIVVPTRVLQKTDGQPFVFLVVRDNSEWKAERRYVTPGLYYRDLTEIRQGLGAGERLVTDGFQNLAQGQKLDVRQTSGE